MKDYEKRHIDETMALSEKISKLEAILNKYKNGSLDFVPKTPIPVLDAQLHAMKTYLDILNYRLELEISKEDIEEYLNSN